MQRRISMITGSPPIMVMWWIRAIGLTPSAFRPFSLTTIHARGAVADLAGAGGGQLAVLGDQLTLRMPRGLASKRMPSSIVWVSVEHRRG